VAVRFNFSIVDAAAVLVPNEAAYWALADDSDVTAFTPDRRVEAIAKPDRCSPWPACKDAEPDLSSGGTTQTVPSGVERIGADATGYGTGIGVAIVDTGLDRGHLDLACGNVAPEYYDAFGGDSSDGNGHGTHVGGIVAACDDDIDVVGVAPQATLYAVRVLNYSGSGTDSTVIAGLDWVRENAGLIDVVNMSLGRPSSPDDSLMNEAIQRVVDADITVVVAAGNDPAKEISDMMPAGHPNAMAVASTTAQGGNNKCKRVKFTIAADTASYFTTDGPGVAISAPGARQENISGGCRAQSVGILSLAMGGGTTRMSGTSMASPHVAGVVALVKEVCDTFTPAQVHDIIVASADFGFVSDNDGNEISTLPIDSPTNGYSFDGMREGTVDAVEAVAAASAALCPPPASS
jgi:subtilisin family serine protease